MPSLVFVDTNIFLDFYRVRGRESGLAFLNHIDAHRERFITGSQVEMEFKKNRQKVILDAHQSIKADGAGVQVPAFLAHSKQSNALIRTAKETAKHVKTLRDRTSKILRAPTTADPVYKAAQRLFRSDLPWNLSRTRKERFRIRRLAYKRFWLGYPPRKDSDTSYGDAINWEWIVACAVESGDDIVIVSRDSDYGLTFDKKPILNDWLLQEFRERVGRQRHITLTARLSDGLKAAGIAVSSKEEKAEDEFLKEDRRQPTGRQYQREPLQGLQDFVRALSAPLPEFPVIKVDENGELG